MATRSRQRKAQRAQSRSASGRETSRGITEEEAEDVEERSSPRAPVIYEVVRRMGEEEMARPATSLWWSGVAAGLSISFSLLAQAILERHLPEATWRPLVSNFGYSVGFLMVVLGRQQLFTENTITAVLPLAAEFTWRNLSLVARLWGIVLVANLVGTFFAALFCTFTPVLAADVFKQMLAISGQLMELTWLEIFFRGIAAGFLMATMVWLIPSSEGAQFFVITLITFLISVGGFTHIVAGSMESFMLVIQGQWGVWPMTGGYMVPVLLGNIVGGTALFALIAYAQVMEEI